MKFPEKIRKYCPKCKTYTIHKVKIETSRKLRRALSKGQRRAERRSKGHGNHGRYSKRPISNWKMHSKTTKKYDLIITCSECNKSRHMSLGRLKTLEIVKT
ncbi:MAG: 50S ribosomal protein L44e [Candidatus Njordarchaeia archaeon]|nr:50S ribosomal protein L44e [Candidatus Korarchaeota archaeon]